MLPVGDEWFTLTIHFAASGMRQAEEWAEDALGAICGGEIGMGLHVCKRHDWVMSVGPYDHNEGEEYLEWLI